MATTVHTSLVQELLLDVLARGSVNIHADKLGWMLGYSGSGFVLAAWQRLLVESEELAIKDLYFFRGRSNYITIAMEAGESLRRAVGK